MLMSPLLADSLAFEDPEKLISEGGNSKEGASETGPLAMIKKSEIPYLGKKLSRRSPFFFFASTFVKEIMAAFTKHLWYSIGCATFRGSISNDAANLLYKRRPYSRSMLKQIFQENSVS